jgi:hypothetical protein
MPVYAVTGASGQFGRFAVQDLLSRNVPASHIVAIVPVEVNSRTSRSAAYRYAKRTIHARKLWAGHWWGLTDSCSFRVARQATGSFNIRTL